MENLSGRTAVITGAASGIGLAMAHRFGQAGMNLVAADVERAALDAAETELTEAGYPVLAHEIDVRFLDQIQALEKAATDRFGNVHLLCNNAGVGLAGAVADTDDIELWRWAIDINLWGVIYGCKVFLPSMLAHGEPAHIVNTASMAGLGTTPHMGAYTISKFGVVALSETMAKEMLVAGADVGVSVLCPAWVNTGIVESGRNLPADLQSDDAVQTEEAEAAQQFMRALVAEGKPPAEVAGAVHDAVVSGRFWILTHEESLPHITARAEDIVNGTNPRLAPGPA